MTHSEITQLTLQAEKFLQADDIVSAEKVLSNILQMDKDHVDVWLLKSKLALKTGNQTQALEALREALRLKPGTEEAVINLVNYHGANKEYDACEAILRKAITAAPNYSRYPFILGNLLLEKGLHAEAIKLMEQARKISPDNPQIILALSAIHGRHGNLDMSLEVIRPLLEVEPPSFPAVIIFANISPALNMVEDCMILLDKLTQQPLTESQLAQLKDSKQMLIKTGV